MRDLKGIAASLMAPGDSRDRPSVQGPEVEIGPPSDRGAGATRIQASLRQRLLDIAGTACMIAALSLLSPGVRTVRADDEPIMSVDPGLAAPAAARTEEKTPANPAAPPPAPAPAKSQPPQAVIGSSTSPVPFPTVHVDDVENARRRGVSAIEIAPGVVVLDTRGFNYGPPPPLAPEALQQESVPR